MKVLITGAFGNIGINAANALLQQGCQLRCLVKVKSKTRRAKQINGTAEIILGDIRDPEAVSAALEGIDAVIHLAFELPPVTDNKPELAREINIGGTQNLVDAMKRLSAPPKIIFSSSLTVFGNTQHLEPPRKVSDPVYATDNYTQHKIECEKMFAESGLNWCIMRFAVVPPHTVSSASPKVFDIPAKTRIEFLHPRDAGLALANAVNTGKVWNKTLLVGGGRGCQLYYSDFLSGMTEAMGLGRLPEEAFGSDPSYTDWLDTSESQSLLNYQQHTFEDYLQGLPKMMGAIRFIVPRVRPIARWYVLKNSPYLDANKKRPL